jgi:hypothetical protein
MAANHSSTSEGFGRLDAVGRIVNQVIRFTSEHEEQPRAQRAPASFPLLWDAPRHDYVQWTGFSANAGAGSLGRNAGEVVGVFGRVDVKHYETRRRPSGLCIDDRAERAGRHGGERCGGSSRRCGRSTCCRRSIAAGRARRRQLYAQHCASCHASIDRDDPKRRSWR